MPDGGHGLPAVPVLVQLWAVRGALSALRRRSAMLDSMPIASTRMPRWPDTILLVVSDSFAARAFWALGHPDQALDRVKRAVAVANRLSHTQSLVVAAHFSAVIYQLRGDVPRCRERAASAVALADEYGLDLWSALGHIYLGWAHVQQTDETYCLGADGSGHRRDAARPCRARRDRRAAVASTLPCAAGRVAGQGQPARRGADCHRRSARRRPRYGRGLRDCGAASHQGGLFLGASESAGPATPTPGRARASRGSASRVGANPTSAAHASHLSPDADGVAEAEACFTRALDVARNQGARSWELRAATSLARLYQSQGRRPDARRLVSDALEG